MKLFDFLRITYPTFIFVFIGTLIIFVIFQKSAAINKRDAVDQTDSQKINSNALGNESIQSFFLKTQSNAVNQIQWGDFDEQSSQSNLNLVVALKKNEEGFSKEGRDFLKYMSGKTFDAFVCGDDKSDARGIYFLPEHEGYYVGNFYDDMLKALKKWEPNILKDIGDTLFPDEALVRDKNLVFGEETSVEELGLKYRKTSFFVEPGEKELFIGLAGGNVILSTTEKCLFLASDDLFDLVP